MKKVITCMMLIGLLSAYSSAKIGIVVNKNLYPFIESSINRYIADLNAIEGKAVWLNATTFDETNSIYQLRDSLDWHFNNDDLEGAVFVGDLPIAEYEIENDHDKYGYNCFPTDLFYMDLDGVWEDNFTESDWNGLAKTGVFDGHSGNRLAEIWVSRITAGILPGLGNEEDIVNSYFSKVHTRMIGQDQIPHRYLVLGNDLEWSSTVSWAHADLLGYHPDSVHIFLRSNEEDTRQNWSDGLVRGYESVLLTEHSGSTSNGVIGGYNSTNYLQTTTNTRYYNLFACSNSRYTVPNFLGGLYGIGHGGLISIGSTKIGSMLGFEHYYEPMAQDSSFGGSFMHWLNNYVLNVSWGSMIDWHYGMTLCGVGTLRLQQPQSHQADVAVYAALDDNPLGNTIATNFSITNNSDDALAMEELDLIYYTCDPNIAASSIVWDCYHTSIGCGNITATSEKLAETVEVNGLMADTRIVFSFAEGISIPAHQTLTMQGVLRDQNWQYSFNEHDDWSHTVDAEGLAENIVLFSNTTNEAVFGNVPEVNDDGILTVSPEQLTFENVANGYSETQTLSLSNDCSVDITVSDMHIDNPLFTHAEQLPITIPAGEQTDISVSFTPDGNWETQHGVITIVSDASLTPEVFVDVTGNGRYVYNLAVTPDPLTTGATITFDNQNPDNVGIDAIFYLSRIFDDGSYESVEEFTETVTDGINSIQRPSWDELPAGDYRLIMRFAGWMVSTDECYFTKNGVAYEYNLAVSPATFRSGAQITYDMPHPGLVNETVQFGLYEIFRNGSQRVLTQEFTHVASSGANTIDKTDWDYLPSGYYVLEMSAGGEVLDNFPIEKLSNAHDFDLTVSPSPVIRNATCSFNIADANLVGETAVLTCKRNGSMIFAEQQTIVEGLNDVSLTFNEYNPLAPGQYRMVLSVGSFDVDSVEFTKEDNSATISATPETVSFGQIVVGNDATTTVTITNDGNSNAVISSIFIADQAFSHNGSAPVSLTPGASIDISLTFAPSVAGSITDTLIIINAPDENVQTLKIPVSGQGSVSGTQSTFQVSMVADGNITGNSIQPQISIQNTGSESVDLSDILVEYYTYDADLNVADLQCDIYYCSENVTTSFSRLASVQGTQTQRADVVTSFSFASGSLASNETMTLNFGMHTANWSYTFDESDDWSHVVDADNTAAYIVIRQISSGQVLYGTPPNQSNNL